MTKLLAIALFVVLTGTIAVHAGPRETPAPSVPVSAPAQAQPAFDTVMPAPAAPFDDTVITPVESVGAARNE